MASTTLKLCYRYSPYILLWLFFLIFQVILFGRPSEKEPSRHDTPAAADTTNTGTNDMRYLKDNADPNNNNNNNLTRPKSADARFNNVDVYYQEASTLKTLPVSDYHCVGRTTASINNKQEQALYETNYSWMFRSCHFQNLCLDTQTKEFLLIDDSTDTTNETITTPPQAVAMGSINPRWSGRGYNKGFHKVKWSPTKITTAQMRQAYKGYYALPDHVVLIPFHSMAAHNVGHLIWDDFYPIFTVLQLFGLLSNNTTNIRQKILPIRWIVPDDNNNNKNQLYATCEMQKKKSRQCQENYQRFLQPLLGVDPQTFSTTKNLQLQPVDNGMLLQSSLVCAKHAVAGIGMLSDHGLRDHGWLLGDPQAVPHNIGRGSVFRDFRDFMVRNVLQQTPPQQSATSNNNNNNNDDDDPANNNNDNNKNTDSINSHKPRKITFSTHSSKGFERSLGFENQTAAVQRALLHHVSANHTASNEIVVQNFTMRDLTIEEQVQVALESAIFVTVSGGGAVTATFLPPGSTLIVYYLEDGGFDYWNTSYTYTPARLDWDLLNTAAHFRVHWLPMKTMNQPGDVKLLEQLVMHELEIMGLLGQ
ncbi:expressed unknown protein [Seminavis robusta]|uniref:Uncharacterized protein n=1 Tax=Seminavis robusta TaxID=568900 RepID=A0A9N8DCQ1_9STRA|nr:expressed unknown protein [Seminavis robusta]|eukprot:Sro80_g042920.1 n/a (589) ;mRNA; f:7914-9774